MQTLQPSALIAVQDLLRDLHDQAQKKVDSKFKGLTDVPSKFLDAFITEECGEEKSTYLFLLELMSLARLLENKDQKIHVFQILSQEMGTLQLEDFDFLIYVLKHADHEIEIAMVQALRYLIGVSEIKEERMISGHFKILEKHGLAKPFNDRLTPAPKKGE